MTERTSIDLDCPGSLSNATVLAVFPATVYGVGHPSNTGRYPLSIGALDRRGQLLNRRHPLELQPGESAAWYHPPANTHKIIAAGWSNHIGTTTLAFDLPNA